MTQLEYSVTNRSLSMFEVANSMKNEVYLNDYFIIRHTSSGPGGRNPVLKLLISSNVRIKNVSMLPLLMDVLIINFTTVSTKFRTILVVTWQILKV